MQSNPDLSAGPHRQALSLLMDGELPPGELAAVVAGFRDDIAARADWHAYHLIGDVLRSEDLAVAPARDEAFLQALRGRLAQEPLPLEMPPLVATAPTPLVDAAAPSAPRRAAGWWVAPVAVAAGFVAVAAVLVVNQSVVSPPAAGPVIAKAPAAPAPMTLVRDAQLDRYLAAHRNLGTGVAGAGGAQRAVQIVYEPK